MTNFAHPHSVLLVGGPMDGHRLVLDTNNRTYRVAVAAPAYADSYTGYDMLDPAKMNVAIAAYDIRPLGTPAQRDPLWVGIFEGVRT